MGSYSTGVLSISAGFTSVCIGNTQGYSGSPGGYSSFSEFVGQIQIYGFSTTTSVSLPSKIPDCQVVGGGFKLGGVLVSDVCMVGQYSLGGVLACSSCPVGEHYVIDSLNTRSHFIANYTNRQIQ